MEPPIINDNYLNLLRELIHQNLGIYISQEKNYLLQSKISRLIYKSNYKNISEFYHLLKNGNKQSFEELIHFITTTHTYFFRENIHLKILRNDILLKKLPFIYIWCAATSTGEEVYSIIIELLESGINNFLIVATDINKSVLIHLKKGIYKMERMRKMSTYLINKYFLPAKDSIGYYQVKDFLKKYFIVKKINLVDNIYFESKFHYIFCRNVLIYFDKATQLQVVNNILNNMEDSGYFFIGHAESLINLNLSNRIETVFSSVHSKRN